MAEELSPEYLKWLEGLTLPLRARKMVEIMIKEGGVSTARLQQEGYSEPRRAAGDLRDAGVAFKSTRVSHNGRPIAYYSLIDTTKPQALAQRKLIPKPFRSKLIAKWNSCCAICARPYKANYLQPDHRVPFRIGGDPAVFDDKALDAFMPLCGPDNRAKSWSCEHCPNWTTKSVATCKTCYWASPDDYDHVATVPERRLTLVVRDKDEISVLDRLKGEAERQKVSLGEKVLSVIRKL